MPVCAPIPSIGAKAKPMPFVRFVKDVQSNWPSYPNHCDDIVLSATYTYNGLGDRVRVDKPTGTHRFVYDA